jgi:uncharacterized protein YdhG (YjbR/CyaY superfamily)
MESNKKVYASIDEYIADCPEDVQKILKEIRAVIHAAAPDALEKISYQMPAFTLEGNLVYFAAFKKHIGFYPTPSGTDQFKREIAGYQAAKGSIQFPLDQPMPYDLIRQIVEFRVQDNLEKAAAKSKKKVKNPGAPV